MRTAQSSAWIFAALALALVAAEPIELSRCRLKFIDNVMLAAERAGVLEYIEPAEGDTVTAGQAVAGLKDEAPQAALKVAERKAGHDIEIRSAQTASQFAQSVYESDQLANQRARGTVSLLELERHRLEAKSAVLRVQQAEHDHEVAKLERDEIRATLDSYRIVAPFEGTVSRVFKSRGEAVAQGDAVLQVVSHARIRVEGYLEIGDAWRVKRGAPVVVWLDIPDIDTPLEAEKFEGRVTFVDSEVQPVTRQVRITAEVPNRDEILKAGLTARMQILPSDETSRTAARTPPSR